MLNLVATDSNKLVHIIYSMFFRAFFSGFQSQNLGVDVNHK